METLKIGTREIKLDPELLKFDETNINDFLKKLPSHYNEFSTCLADANYVLAMWEDKYDRVFAEKFTHYKEIGGTDKLCEFRSRSDPEIVDILENCAASKRNVNLLNGFVKALDKAHENSKQLSYTMRKEMDKLYGSY